MSVQFTIDDRGLKRAMMTYAVMRNKSDADVVNKAMRYWLPFAAKRVKDATKHTTPGKVRADLKGNARKISTKATGRNRQLRNSVAAAIVASRWRDKGKVDFAKKIRGKRAWINKASIDFFYSQVERLINARVRSVNYLRAGFIPAFQQFEVPNRGVPGHRRFKGRSRGIKAKPSFTKEVAAYATNQREGAFEMAPYAFKSSLRDVQAQFLRWLRADVEGTAKRSGFG